MEVYMPDAYVNCCLCGKIPDLITVELLHSDERLPPEVDRLRIIGGYCRYDSPQIRVCPECGTYYEFIHEHDSEAGMGEGYTDESIARITSDKAAASLEKARHSTALSIEYWQTSLAKGDYVEHAKKTIPEEQAELAAIEREIALLAGKASK